MQDGVSMPGETPPAVSEDCLYLNIWTPASSAHEHLPVIVWIYGGGYINGSSSMPLYWGDKLAHKGIIVVTIAYRLGPLGFLAYPELTRESPHHSSGNYGLMDQIAALEWVQRNIAAFWWISGIGTRLFLAVRITLPQVFERLRQRLHPYCPIGMSRIPCKHKLIVISLVGQRRCHPLVGQH